MSGSPLSPQKGLLFVKNARLLDPKQNLDVKGALLVEDGKVKAIGANLTAPANAKVIDAKGWILAPGLVDIHVHLREPGGEAKETIATGTRAAAAGGVTTVVSMPNTSPPMDNVSDIQFVTSQAAKTGYARVYPTGTITKEREGSELSEIGAMVKAGCVAITDDGSGIQNAQLLRRAFEYSKTLDLILMEHSEDADLQADGVMNEGPLATRLGLKGIPKEAEYMMVARNISLARLTGGRLHLTHVSTKESIDSIRQAKEEGLNVTADVTPHHLILTEEAVQEYKANAKMNPPLRAEADAKACREALKEGVLDCVASDHAPHTASEKAADFSSAPFGIIGLETTLPLLHTELVATGFMTLSELWKRCSMIPAHIFKLPGGSLEPGSHADFVLFDPEGKQTMTHFVSRSQNSPFLGWRFQGIVERTFLGGQTVFERSASPAKPHPSPL